MGNEARSEDILPLTSITGLVTLPTDFVVRRVRNVREAELLLRVASAASNFESAVAVYEVLALTLEELKKGWDALWISNEPYLTPAIPLIGQAMSQQNAARGHVLQQIEELVGDLQQQAAALVQFADMHRSYARELSAEGLDKLAAEKLLICDVEQELSARITRICNGGGLAGLPPLSDLVHQRETSLINPSAPTTHDTVQEHKNDNLPSEQHARPVEVEEALAAARRLAETGKHDLQSGGESLGVGAQGEEEKVEGSKGACGDAATRDGGNDFSYSRPEQDAGGTPAEPVTAVTAAVENGGNLESRTGGTDRVLVDTGSKKRLREDDTESGRSKAPRVAIEPVQTGAASRAGLRSDGEQNESRADVEPNRPAPFLPNLAGSFQLEERPDESGSKEAAGSEEIDWARLREQKGVGMEGASTPASEGVEKSTRENGKLGAGTGSEAERGSQKEKDASISSRERQLLTDEKLTPGSGSVSRGNPPPTQSPPSSGRVSGGSLHRGPGGSPQDRHGGFSGSDERQAADRKQSLGGLFESPGSDGDFLRKPPLNEDNVADGGGAMQPPRTLQYRSVAGDADAGRGKTSDLRLKETRTVQGPLFPTPVEDDPPRGANSPSSQTQSLFQSQGEQAGSQPTPGSKIPLEKNVKGDGQFGSPPLFSAVAFNLRLSNSSSSPSKSPGSEKLSQSGALFETGVRGQIAGEELEPCAKQSGGTIPADGVADVRNEGPEWGIGKVGLDSDRLRFSADRTEGLGSEMARLVNGMVERGSGEMDMAGGTEKLTDGTAALGGERVGLNGGRTRTVGDTAKPANRSREAEGGTAGLNEVTAEPPSFAAPEAAGNLTSAAVIRHASVFERSDRQAELGARGDRELRRVFVHGDTLAVAQSGRLEALPARERISGTLSRGGNAIEGPDPSFSLGEATEGGAVKERRLTVDEPPGSYVGVWAYEPQWRETASQELPSSYQDHSLLGDKAQGDVAKRSSVPDSEEEGSRSGGRGVEPGPTPPPSSKSDSRGDLPKVSDRALLEREATPEVPNRAIDGAEKAGDGEPADGTEMETDSGGTELVLETEEREEETEEQGEGQERPPQVHERALSASPCRASESPMVSGSQPLSQSQVC